MRFSEIEKKRIYLTFSYLFLFLSLQARKVDDNEPAGLVPSQTLEEKRKAFVKPEYDYTKSSCKHAFTYIIVVLQLEFSIYVTFSAILSSCL